MVYTDGSKTLRSTGIGGFGPRTEYCESMGNSLSIIRAEVYAIDRFAQFNLETNYRGRDIAILSDSQGVIKALSSYSLNSNIVWGCLKKLNTQGKNNKVTLRSGTALLWSNLSGQRCRNKISTAIFPARDAKPASG